MDFAGGYKDRNKEMNELYLSYSQLAKILAVGHDFGLILKEGVHSFEHRFDLLGASQVFEDFDNKLAQGKCIQNLGCLIAHQDFAGEYPVAKKKIKEAINLQLGQIENLNE